MQHVQANRAYRAASAHRGIRAQEADVFRRMTGRLRAAQHGTPIDQARAIADNARLWQMVGNLLQDPANGLPANLRASIVSVGLALQREMRQPAPDFAFLIAVNDDIAAGLSGAS